MRAKVESIMPAFPNWSWVKMEGFEQALLCDNWNGDRVTNGFKPLEVGDELEFEVSDKGAYSNEGPYLKQVRMIE